MTNPLLLDEDALDDLRGALLAWYGRRARELPWRDDPHPYKVWISEVMLQQTQVATVIPYFERWLTRFPTVDALADANTDDVLAAWSGLGYYRRARNLQKAARLIVDEHGGELPDTLEGLLALPGVGRYTAGAIASIAFGLPAPIVDGNVIRVVTRLRTIEGDPTRSAVQRQVWTVAEHLVDPDQPGTFNQALMELGSLVCRPRNPRCTECPIEPHCLAHATGRQHELPSPKPKRTRHRTVAAALLVRVDRPDAASRYLLARRNAELLGGLWSLPTVELLHIEGRKRDPANADAELAGISFFGAEVRHKVAALAGTLLGELAPPADGLRALAPVDHGFTHIEYTLVPWLCVVSSTDGALPDVALDEAHGEATRFVTPDELATMGVPRMIERVFDQL